VADTRNNVSALELGYAATTDLFSPAGTAYRIHNLELSREGSLRVVKGPVPWLPEFGGQGLSAKTDGRHHGLYHAMLGKREVLLCHAEGSILEFRGWESTITGKWTALQTGLPDENWAKFPTQFESDGKRVFIAPGMGQTVYAYDGERWDVLGYPLRPAAPVIMESELSGEIGTVDETFGEAEDGGSVLPGVWDYHMAYQDIWGDTSAWSIEGSISTGLQQNGSSSGSSQRMTFIVTVATGTDKTESRRLARTPDKVNSGSVAPQELIYGLGFDVPGPAFPDNISMVLSDGNHDGTLGPPTEDLRSTPRCSLLRMAMGRLFMANEHGDPGILYWSKEGRPGTFGTFDFRYPDPQGAEVTGLAKVARGLLAMTTRGVFLVEPSQDTPDTFISRPVPGGLGCLAPSSIQTMANGLTVWLGPGPAFYAYDGSKVVRVSDSYRDEVETISRSRAALAVSAVNPGTGEYYCSVSTGRTMENDTTFVWDGQRWRTRDEVRAHSMCVMSNHVGAVLCGGKVGSDVAVWVMNHEAQHYDASGKTATYESRWWQPPGGPGSRDTVVGLIIWMRESRDSDVQLTFFRDGARGVPVGSPETGEEYFTAGNLYADAPASLWGTVKLGEDGARWGNRRPFFRRVFCHIPSAESVAFKLQAVDMDFELLGYAWISSPRSVGGGGRIPT